MKQKIALGLVLILLPLPAAAQPAPLTNRPPTIGVELDILPYATGGWYGSLWAGDGPMRFRAVASRVHVPSIAIPEGFQNQRLTAVAALCDLFPAGNFEHWWVGGGAEYWSGTIEEQNTGATGNYHSYLLTLGTGYVWKVTGNFYLNPWTALHVVVAGTNDVPVGASSFSPRTVTAEASLKIGWHF